MDKQYLYQKLTSLKEAGMLKELPNFLNTGLSTNIQLREYQEEAFKYFVTYFENDNLKMENQKLRSENENLKYENEMGKYAIEFLNKLKNKLGSKFESFKNDLFPKSSHKHTTENPKIKRRF